MPYGTIIIISYMLLVLKYLLNELIFLRVCARFSNTYTKIIFLDFSLVLLSNTQ